MIKSIPLWLTDSDTIGPCPCGKEKDEEIVYVRGEAGLVRWMHARCLPLLHYEEDDEQTYD
jgi:hypothetical protein